MRNSFNASVPARKPKTAISRVLNELTSEATQVKEVAEDDVLRLGIESREDEPALEVVEGRGRSKGAASSARAAVKEPPVRPVIDAPDRDVEPEAALRAAAAEPIVEADVVELPSRGAKEALVRVETESPTRAATPEPAGRPAAAAQPAVPPASLESTRRMAELAIAASRDRLAALRERLTIASRPPQKAPEPRTTTEAVRHLIEDLRARLEAAAAENARVRQEMEEMREMLARAELQKDRERRLRAELEGKFEEGRAIADEAVAEAEALAAERDLVLAELAERRRLDDEHTALLEEAEAALDQFRAERDEALRKLAEANEKIDLHLAQIAELESRLQAEVAERERAEARARELEAEVARLNEAMDALEEIQGIVARRR